MKKQSEYFLACLTLFGALTANSLYGEEVEASSEPVQVVVQQAGASSQPSEVAVESQISQSEQQLSNEAPTPSADSAKTKQNFVSTYDRIQGKEILPSYGPKVSGGADVYLEASYIYWYLSELGLEFAGTNFAYNASAYPDQVSSNNEMPKGKVYTSGNKSSSGFKVGAGIDFEYDGWDLNALYTWYRNHHMNSVSSPIDFNEASEKYFYPIENIFWLIELNSYPAVATARAENRYKLNVIDLTLSKSLFLSPKLVLSPNLGLKGTWGRQLFDVSFLGSEQDIAKVYPLHFNTENTSGQLLAQIYQKQYNWGLGTRFGLDTSWLFTRCFSLFGECAVTALWQYIKTERTDVYDAVYNTFENPEGTILSDYTDVRYHQIFHTVNPVLETQIGFRYDHEFSNCDYRVRAQIGWEAQVWFNQNALLTQYGQNQAYQNIALQGLNLTFRLDF